MKRAAAVALVLLLLPAAAAAFEIRSYHVVLLTDGRGGHATVDVAISGAAPGEIALPVGFSGVTNARLLSAPPATALTAEPLNLQTLARVVFPANVPADVRLVFAFDVAEAFVPVKTAKGEKSTLPAGAETLRLALLNTQPATILDYRAEAVIPDGLRAHAVREALPRPGKSEAEPRVRLDTIGGRSGARIRVPKLLQGETASMQLELVPRARSAGWLIAGALLSILYLIYFRDLVAKKP